MKRYWTGTLAALLLALSSLVSAPSAAASDALEASDPAPREELSSAPGGVTLAFDREIEPDAAKVLVLDPNGRNVVLGDLDYFGSTIGMILSDDLPRGTYTVRFRIPGAKGEPEGGSFQFSIGPGKWTDPLPDESWSGLDQQPADLGEPGSELPEGTPSPEASESEPPPVVFESPTASPSPEITDATEEPAESPSAAPQPSGGADWWPWAAGGAVVVAAAGAGAWMAARKRGPNDQG